MAARGAGPRTAPRVASPSYCIGLDLLPLSIDEPDGRQGVELGMPWEERDWSKWTEEERDRYLGTSGSGGAWGPPVGGGGGERGGGGVLITRPGWRPPLL